MHGMYIRRIDFQQTKVYSFYRKVKVQLLKQTPPYGSTKCVELNNAQIYRGAFAI
jgi:hypothetical protein